MAEASTTFKTQKSYFHNFSRVAVHSTQQVYESTFRNGHRVMSDDVWIDPIDFCPTEVDADSFASSHPGIVKKHTAVGLSEVAGSNGQMYRVIDTGTWVNKWIAPTDSLNSMGETSHGFACKLTQNNGVTISLTEGVHIRNYFNGTIEFQAGYTPTDLGYQLPLKVTFYEYVGKTLDDVVSATIRECRDRRDIIDSGLVYMLSQSPITSPKIFCNGILLGLSDYVVDGTTVTFSTEVIEVGDKIDFIYNY